MPSPKLIGLLSILLLAAGLWADPPPEPAKVEVLREWRGQIRTPFRPSLITDQEAFATAWAVFEQPGPAPSVDFREHAVIAAAVRTSGLFARPTLDADGDLHLGVVATPDQPPFHSCILALIPRAGVKSVEGKPLGD